MTACMLLQGTVLAQRNKCELKNLLQTAYRFSNKVIA